MSHSPHSRTPSRAVTPIPSFSPPRLMTTATLITSLSTTNPQYQSRNSRSPSPPLVPPFPPHLMPNSSTSSVLNLDIGEGIMIQDSDVDAETTDAEESTVLAQLQSNGTDEDARKTLRDQLRRTLNERPSTSDLGSRLRSRTKQCDTHEIALDTVLKYPPREYFILSDAGKPVFVSRPGGEDSNNMTSAVGVMQALISVFLDEDDKIRCINAGNSRITFLLRPPLYYVCVSAWGEPESVTRSHLEYLHLQILSVVTGSQLRRIFERRTNFDLKRLLSGAEGFLTSLLEHLEFDLSMTTSALNCLRLDVTLRKQAGDALVPVQKMKDVLYVLLIAQGRVVTLLRPRKHSIHPADIHILLNTIHSPSVTSSPASSSWIPICLPKFNPSGFVNAYITFLYKDVDGSPPSPRGSSPPEEASPRTTINSETITSGPLLLPGITNPGLSLVCVSGGGDFESIRNWCDSVVQRLESNGTLNNIYKECQRGRCDYSISELGIPGLRHFVYKSRPHVQITIPRFEDPYDSTHERRRLITLYQVMHDAIHAKSGQSNTLKLQYLRTDKECVMGWITQPFELWISVSPRLPKSAAVKAANAVARWVKKEEAKLFLKDAPVF